MQVVSMPHVLQVYNTPHYTHQMIMLHFILSFNWISIGIVSPLLELYCTAGSGASSTLDLTIVVFTCVRFWDWPWLLELQAPGWRAWGMVRLPWWDRCRACSGSGHCSCSQSAQAWKCLSAPKSTDWPLRRPGSGAAHREKGEGYYSQLQIKWR